MNVLMLRCELPDDTEKIRVNKNPDGHSGTPAEKISDADAKQNRPY
jgi:hypothetical protein